MISDQSLGTDYFEALYRSDPDPWNFATSEYEDKKYQATVGALAQPSYMNALEVGCSIGVLTARLAPRCKRLEAVDLSPTAITTAKLTCRMFDNVRFQVAAAPGGLPNGPFDLIIFSEVLYYLCREDLLSLALWCRASAASSAEIILCHWLGETNYPLSGKLASELFVQALQPCLESHAVFHEDVYRLERIRLSTKIM